MRSVLAIDPGKTGALCLLTACGTRSRFWRMPYTGSNLDPHALADVYHEIQRLCKTPPMVVIERIFTMPTDAISQQNLKDMGELVKLLMRADAGDENPTLGEEIQTMVDRLAGIDFANVRVDGRVGMSNYAKGYGMLHMPILWGWTVVTFSPKTWQKEIFKLASPNQKAKDKAYECARRLHPELFVKGADENFWPERARKPLDGAVDALCIAEYARMSLMAKEWNQAAS